MKRNNSRINLRNPSKREKKSSLDYDPDDRISVLPDSILSVILSFLPIKDAIATDILSKRWKSVWMTVDSLNFYHNKGCSKQLAKGEDTKFVRFVNRVLFLHNVGSLNKFRLVWNPSHVSSSHVSSWISTAITRIVREIFLCTKAPSRSFISFEIPVNVFSCVSLRSLELDGVFDVSAETVVSLPRLESLKIVSSYFLSEEALEKLISGCPMLNYLHLHMDLRKGDDHIDDCTCRISSTSLRRLELHFGYECGLKLEAPSLEYFKLYGHISEIFVQRSLSSLLEVDFGLKFYERQFYRADLCNLVVEAVCAFDCAKSLTLSIDTIQALNCATVSLWTKFKRLVKVTAFTFCCHSSSLRDLIQNSDNLEVLVIYQYFLFPRRSEMQFYSKWNPPPVEVPRCLSNSLKKVVLDYYKGYKDEREMIRYIIKHGSVLEVMKIFDGSNIYDGAESSRFKFKRYVSSQESLRLVK